MNYSSENSGFEALLQYIKQSRAFDFTGYKRSSLMRRVNKRMQTVGIKKYDDYLDYLEVHPDEFNSLFNTLLINVTSFFRDRPTWDYIGSTIIPRILADKKSGDPIRIWSAACASGEEAYTIAIVMAQLIGMEQFRERVKIYATDVDEEALSQARQAIYPKRDLEGLSPEEIELFFEPVGNFYSFRKELRRSVIFGRHDLTQDAPISRVDLLICRNALMYFNADTQAKIITRFHFALRDHAFLCLGKAEMLLTYANTFAPVELKRRIFTKVPRLNSRDQLLPMKTGNSSTSSEPDNSYHIQNVAFDRGPLASLVVNAEGLLTLVNEQARVLFNLTTRDIGRPLQDLEVSYRPLELRSCINQVYSERRPFSFRDVEWLAAQGEKVFLDVRIEPLLDQETYILGVSITFTDVSRYKRLQGELEHSNQELETAYEELQCANEELETTNEELQSSNEELETTNEELQATNEELETMNEELQATNEELYTVNDELHRRGDELNQANAFLESILSSLKGGVVVVDRDLHIQIWNYRSEDLWGLRTGEALGQNFLNLDIGLPVEQLRQSMRACLTADTTSATEITLDAINRRGRQIKCHVSCAPLLGITSQVQGVILLMEDRSEGEL
ncbi:CheR family methyltransferase [Trichocoleus sp. FACHB-262]|uniref:CheR family methyltransferase n=1 Tax=Trichocoleus sp. FACHB-262 TaxID=2692869 RepID=UPI001689D070|nr:CheR family methyltransferase [Trichocoleus sp. FACHB-262]MBD2120355.1 PAS domain-containing protein [Trichocoleus sp. FACHB-262]